MAIATRDAIGILADNLRLRGSVLPLSSSQATGWARGLNLPRGGETVLYTGQMYQLIPFIEGMVKVEGMIGASPLANLAWLGRRVNKFLPITRFMTLPSKKARAEYDRVLVDIARLLREAGVEFGYLYEDDLYSGALAHDMGLDEVVADHARKVAAIFERRGVRNVITVDPHTTNMLRSVYPELVPGYDVKVRSYLEVLWERMPAVRAPLSGEVAVHDSCVFARYEGVVDEPRNLLTTAGISVREPEHTGLLTWCCGGPAESLYPDKAQAQAEKRVEELRQAAPDAVTMCPICLVNLKKAAGETLRINDISRYLAQAYTEKPAREGAVA